MLQINSGKLFQRGVGRTNQLRGVLYSNGWLISDDDIVTEAGTLKNAGSVPNSRTIVYELTERIEEEGSGPGILVSHTIKPYIDEFAMIASFALDVIVTPEHDLLAKLLHPDAQHSPHYAPNKYVKRFFDSQANILDDDTEEITLFVKELISLERKYYLGAMRSVRTYIAALHSMPTDLGRAYTLFVSAVEALAQDFDGYKTKWTDVNDRKRGAIEAAMQGLDQEVIEKLQAAIIEHDHLALTRRYNEFVLAKVGPDFFRQETSKGGRAIARWEIVPALKQAYGFRSGYIHSAKQLPDRLTMAHQHWEITEVDRRPALTFEGLKRITRHVIREFVRSAPKTPTEHYDYSLERSGIVQMQLASQYWVGAPLKDALHARRRLEGFLQQLSVIYSGQKDAALTDLRPVLADIERIFPQSSGKTKPAMYALHVLFNLSVRLDQRSVGWKEFLEKYAEISEKPESEVLICRTVLDNQNWPLETHKTAYENYWSERATRSGIHAPRILEAAMALSLAERYREVGDLDAVKVHVAEAVECFPDNAGLRVFENESVFEQAINWRDILVTRTADKSDGDPEGMLEGD